jgi:hypothetical protein
MNDVEKKAVRNLMIFVAIKLSIPLIISAVARKAMQQEGMKS